MATIVNRLKSGQAFRIWLGAKEYLDYRLIHVNECRAYVEPLHRNRKADILEDLPGSGGRVNIAPNCDCEIIDEELEQIMKPTTTAAAPKKDDTKKKEPTAPRGADRKYEAKKQERPVREGTIRAKLLAAIEGGKSDIPKLMKEFDMPRSLLIAHVHEFWNCHGYGYSVTGDVVKVTKPVGGVMKPAAAPAKKKAADPLEDRPKRKSGKKAASAKSADPFDDEDEDPLA